MSEGEPERYNLVRERSRCVKIKNIKKKIFYMDVLKTIHIKDK